MSPLAFLRRWLFRRLRPETGTIVLQRRRIYILPTRAGLFFGLVLTLMYLGAVNYNLGLGHALVFLLVGIGLVGMVHTYRNLLDLNVSAGTVEPVFAGQTASFPIVIDNRRDEARPAIRLRVFDDNATSADTDAVVADLAAGERRTLTLNLPAPTRGRLHLPRLTLATRYPLGFFRAWAHPWPDIAGVVYPTPFSDPLPFPVGNDRTAGDAPASSDDPDDFAGFRRHQCGDSLRHVAWKAYARDAAESPLLVKEFSGSGLAHYCFDWRQTDGDVETRLSRLCGWILQARGENADFALELPGLSLPPGRGDAHAARALEALALFEATAW